MRAHTPAPFARSAHTRTPTHLHTHATAPQAWNRGPQKTLQSFAGNGIFTSSTFDPDWPAIHGLLPRFYNVLKIQGYYPASAPRLCVLVCTFLCVWGGGHVACAFYNVLTIQGYYPASAWAAGVLCGVLWWRGGRGGMFLSARVPALT